MFTRIWRSSLPSTHSRAPQLGHLVFQGTPVSPGATAYESVSLGADFQEFEGAARVILGNAWHNTFLIERYHLVLL